MSFGNIVLSMDNGGDRVGSSKNTRLNNGFDGEMSRLLRLTALLLLSNGESTRCSKSIGDLLLGNCLVLEMNNGDDDVGVVICKTLPKPSVEVEHFGGVKTGETGEIVKLGNDVGLGNVIGKAFFFFGILGGVLLVVLTLKPSDNSDATNRSSPVIKGGFAVVDFLEKVTASAVFFVFFVFLIGESQLVVGFSCMLRLIDGTVTEGGVSVFVGDADTTTFFFFLFFHFVGAMI
jgi:hypothetical protein